MLRFLGFGKITGSDRIRHTHTQTHAHTHTDTLTFLGASVLQDFWSLRNAAYPQGTDEL